MLFRSNKYLEESNKNTDYIFSIVNFVEENIILSADEGNGKSFRKLVLFLRERMAEAIDGTISNYALMINSPLRYYRSLPNSFKTDLIEIQTIRYTENISISNHTLNKNLADHTYHSLINLVWTILDERDSERFNLLIKKLKEQMFLQSHFDKDEEDKYKLKFVLTIYFWILLLHNANEISIRDFELNEIKVYISNYFSEKETLINTFYELKNDSNIGLWNIQNWTLFPPPIGEAYFVMTPREWMYFGFVIMLLEFNFLDYQIEFDKIKLLDEFRFKPDVIIANLELIEANKLKWFNYLYHNTEYKNIDDEIPNELDKDAIEERNESFNYSKSKILAFYNQLEKLQQVNYYSRISEIPLSTKRIKEFKKNVGKSWDSNSIIPTILKHYNRVAFEENVFDKKGLGEFRRMLKGRIAFIEGEEYQNIIGLSDLGGQVARYVNDDFFRTLNSKSKQNNTILLSSTNLSKEIDDFLKNFEDKSSVVIFANWKAVNSLQKDVEYLKKSEIPFSYARYKGIPIINQFSFNDFVYIIDLSSIDYKIYTKGEWYNNELFIDVTEPLPEQIDGITLDTAKEWSNDDVEYSVEDVKEIERSSVNLKILFKSDLIVNDNRFKVIKFESSNLF